MECLRAETVSLFVHGQLTEGEVADVEAHVRSCQSCEMLLSAAIVAIFRNGDRPGEGAPAVTSSGPASLSELTPGTTVGRYMVLATIGHGGMGDVYLAYDPELDRNVALKLLRERDPAHLGKDEVRLLREAQATARLSHPNVITVYDVGTFGDRPFVAMQHIDGQTVTAWLAERRPSWRQVIAVFKDAARGLEAAHRAGFVHRDFKPQNVMIGRDGIVRVMDFGLVRRIGDREESAAPQSVSVANRGAIDLSVTGTGELVGTPLYIAPEQFSGKPTDARSDQFSFCVALYRALYGEHPFFDAQGLSAAVAASLLGRVRPAPAGAAVPQWLRRLLLRGLRADPADRFPSMTALLEALDRDPTRRARRWAVILGTSGLAAGIILYQHAALRGPRLCRGGAEKLTGTWETAPGTKRSAVERAFLVAGPNYRETWSRVASVLDGYAREWVGMYTDACEATHVRGDQSAEVLDLRMTCLEQPLQALGALTDVLARGDKKTLDESINAVHALPSIGRCANIAVLKSAVPAPGDSKIRKRVDQIESEVEQVQALTNTGNWPEAQRRVDPLVDQAAATSYEPVLADVLAAQGWLEQQSGREQEGLKSLERALWSAVAAHRDDLAAQVAAELVGVAGYSLGRFDDAERWKNLCQSLLKRLGPGQERTEAWLDQDWGLTEQRAGRHEQAVQSIRRAIALKERALPADHPDIGISWMGLAELLSEGGDYPSAFVAIEKALGLFRKTYGSESIPFADAIGIRGEVLAGLGRFSEAEKDDRECLEQREAIDPTRAWVAYPLTALGKVLVAEGRLPEAVSALERALRIRDSSESNAALVAETEFALARALRAASGNNPRARLFARRAAAKYRDLPGQSRQAAQIDRWLAEGGAAEDNLRKN